MYDLKLVGTAVDVDKTYGLIQQLVSHLTESYLVALRSYVDYRLGEIERVRQIKDVMDPEHIDNWWGATPVQDLVTDKAKYFLHGIYHAEWNPKQLRNKIHAIKALREELQLGLREAKVLCDAYLHLHEEGTIAFPLHLLELIIARIEVTDDD